MKARKSLSHKWSFFLGAGVTAAVLLLAGNLLPLGTTPDTSPIEMPTVAEATADGSNVAFERSIKVHFRESQDYLDGLQLDVSDPSVSNRNLLILQMIEQNRFYEKVAKQNDAPELARVLRAFEPVLLELAQEDISTEQAEALRAKLTFQLNVMLTKLARTASNDAITT